MALKDAPKIDRDVVGNASHSDLLDMIQELTDKAYHNRQLFEFACRDHVHDVREVELELDRAGIPEDDGYGCYPLAERVRMLAKKVKE